MGMFDYIYCEYPLPVSEIEEQMDDVPNWQEMEFQTKGLGKGYGGFLDKYTIEDDGQIYLDKIDKEWHEDEETGEVSIREIPSGVEKQEYTGELHFYGMHLDTDYDFFMEFKALFWKGELKEIYLEEYKKEDNKPRKEETKKIRDKIVSEEKKASGLSYKIMKIPKSIVFFLTRGVRLISGLVVNLTWRLERLIS